MVAKVHPSTLKSAEAKGFQITGGPDDEFYTVLWPETKKKIAAVDAKVALADMVTFKMLAIEHPKVKAAQSKDDGTWSLKRGTKVLAEGFKTLAEAWEAHLQVEAEAQASKPAATEGSADGSRSIVKRQYREAYKEHGHSTGDEVAERMKTEFTGEDGRMNRDKLVRFAKKNDLWDDKYEVLNNGQVRMNVSNRLRKRMRAEEGFAPTWVK